MGPPSRAASLASAGSRTGETGVGTSSQSQWGQPVAHVMVCAASLRVCARTCRFSVRITRGEGASVEGPHRVPTRAGAGGADAVRRAGFGAGGRARGNAPGQDRPLRRDLPGEPQLRQPVWRLGGCRRGGACGCGTHDAGRPGRGSVRLPAAERRQHRAGVPAERTVPDRAVHSAIGKDLPERCQGPDGAAGRLHARSGSPLLPGAVPAQRRAAEPLYDRQ